LRRPAVLDPAGATPAGLALAGSTPCEVNVRWWSSRTTTPAVFRSILERALQTSATLDRDATDRAIAETIERILITRLSISSRLKADMSICSSFSIAQIPIVNC
jgi:hypothetical protein